MSDCPSSSRRRAPERRAAPAVMPVSLLVSSARLLIERHLGLMWVSGEISNFTRAASGHCYFNLKDAQAQVRCVLFRTRAQHVDFALRDGLAVEVRATPSIFEARGEFQLNVDNVRLAGVGALYEQFARLEGAARGRGLVRAGTQAAAARVSARHRHRHLAARRGAARHPGHARAGAGRRLAWCSTPPPSRARARGRRSRRRSGSPMRGPTSTCCSWPAAAARSRICGHSTRKRWRRRSTARACPWSPASGTKPTSPSATSWPTCARPPRRRRQRRRRRIGSRSRIGSRNSARASRSAASACSRRAASISTT